MNDTITPIDPKTHDFHFDVRATIDAGYKVFDHDYRPVHGRVNALFSQDLPKELKAVNGSVFHNKIDPYLGIARLRKLFQGKNRKLAGFMFLVRGVKGPRDGQVYTLKNRPVFKKTVVTTVADGMSWHILQDYGVSRMAALHLTFYMAFRERKLNYYKTVAGFQEDVANGDEGAWEALKALKASDGMQHDQWDDKVGRNFVKQFPTISLQREALMLPGIYNIPMNHKLTWSDVELCMKDLLENGVKNDGYIGYGSVDILACDTKGACTVGTGHNGISIDSWAHFGNAAYHSQFQDAAFAVIGRDFPEIPDFNDRFNKLGEIYHNAFAFNLKEFMARKRPLNSSFEAGHNDGMKEWMARYRQEFLDGVLNGKYENSAVLAFTDKEIRTGIVTSSGKWKASK